MYILAGVVRPNMTNGGYVSAYARTGPAVSHAVGSHGVLYPAQHGRHHTHTPISVAYTSPQIPVFPITPQSIAEQTKREQQRGANISYSQH